MRRYFTTLILGMALSHLAVTAGIAADAGSTKQLGDVLLQQTTATHFIWTDNNWYEPGDTHTLRWTFDPKNDPYPFTIFVYLENIRTGERTYVANGSLSSQPSDVFGNAPGAFLPIRPGATRAQQLVSGPAPSEVGNYHYVAELRDVTGTQTVKTAYWKFNVVGDIVTLGEGGEDTEISEDTTWTADTLYRIRHQVFVNSGATLTVEPGTLVVASGQNAVIVVERGGRMMSVGRRDLPIVYTCDEQVGNRTSGCWAGLIVLGAAPENFEGEPVAEGVIPASRPVYGGDQEDDDSGVYKYTRVEFAGVDFSNEIQPNAFGFHGVGSSTEICYIQAHEGEDDGIEFFGGTASMNHFVSDGSKDDSLDSALGWTGYAQFGFILQDSVEADSGYEGDSNENGFDNLPRNDPKMYNITFWGTFEGSRGYRTRRGHAGTLQNAIIANFGNDGYEGNNDSFADVDSVIFWNNREGVTSSVADQLDEGAVDIITSGDNVDAVAPMLRNVRYEGNPDPRPTEGSAALLLHGAVTPPAVDGGCYCGPAVDSGARFRGGFQERDNWLEEWTFFGTENNYDDDPSNDFIPE